MTDEEGERPKIVITVQDIQPISKSPEQQHIEEVTSKAKVLAVAKMNSSTSLGDYMRYHFAAMVSTPKLSGWMFDDNPDIKPEDLLDESEDSERKKKYEKEGDLAEEMRSQLEQIQHDGKMKIALARVRNDSRFGGWTYRVLAAFPNGEKALDEVSGNSSERQTAVDYVYYEPQTACVQHACDTLYKKNKKEGSIRAISVMTADYLSFADAYDAVSKHTEDGKSEFVLDTSLDGQVITQTPEKYVVAGIQNVFSNEWNRVRVSDFWSKATDRA